MSIQRPLHELYYEQYGNIQIPWQINLPLIQQQQGESNTPRYYLFPDLSQKICKTIWTLQIHDPIIVGRKPENLDQAYQYIAINEQTISRTHAIIKYIKSDKQFYLDDVGSSQGTYVKIQNEQELYPGLLLEVGTSLFQVLNVNIDKEEIQLLIVVDGEGLSKDGKKIIAKNNFRIGRKSDNEIAFSNDRGMSKVHAVFKIHNGKAFIEDCKSTNGTWQRLSLPNETGQKVQLYNQIKIRFGMNYICTFEQN